MKTNRVSRADSSPRLAIVERELSYLVERRIVLEIKSTERLSDVPKRQLRNYLAATNLELGIILHFGPKAEYHRVLYTKQV